MSNTTIRIGVIYLWEETHLQAGVKAIRIQQSKFRSKAEWFTTSLRVEYGSLIVVSSTHFPLQQSTFNGLVRPLESNTSKIIPLSNLLLKYLSDNLNFAPRLRMKLCRFLSRQHFEDTHLQFFIYFYNCFIAHFFLVFCQGL